MSNDQVENLIKVPTYNKKVPSEKELQKKKKSKEAKQKKIEIEEETSPPQVIKISLLD